MRSPINIYLDYALAHYDFKRYVTYKKAQFVAILSMVLFILLLLLTIYAATSGREMFFAIVRTTTPVMVTVFILIVLIRKEKADIAADVLAIVACLVVSLGFFGREVHLVGVTLGYFMFVDVAYSVLFARRWVSWLVYISFMIVHPLYFILIARPSAEGLILEMATMSMIEGLITLTMVFVTVLFTSSFLRQSLFKTKEDSVRNRSQYQRISNMMKAIRETSDKLTDSVKITSGVINTFTDNAQSQAASVEELSATVEEISAGTENVASATDSQNESIQVLANIFEELSGSIDNLELNGREISEQFISFMELAREGEQSSSQLEQINQKIWENSNNIQSVVTMIEEFFDKINLLSLNASIEAARAGEFGRGFAVVADEIGKLADTSSQQLKQITDFITRNDQDVKEANTIITGMIGFLSNLLTKMTEIQEKSSAVLDEINREKGLKENMSEQTGIVKEKSEEIEIAMKEQQNAINDVMKSIENTNRIVQDNTSNIEHLRDNSSDLKNLAVDLENKFISGEEEETGDIDSGEEHTDESM